MGGLVGAREVSYYENLKLPDQDAVDVLLAAGKYKTTRSADGRRIVKRSAGLAPLYAYVAITLAINVLIALK